MTSTLGSTESAVLPEDRARIFALTSALLTYPDAELLSAHTELAAAAEDVADGGARTRLRTFLGWLAATPAVEVQRHYVATFDLRRRSGLFLTYYLHGDTRKRGIALLTLKQRYRAQGLTLATSELPDFLPLVLEFAALAGPGDGEAPLRQHRRGLELLRVALEESDSPYRLLLEVIVTALPPLTAADEAAIAELALAGPPVESVGLDPYGSTSCEFTTAGPRSSGPDDLAAVGLGPDLTVPTRETP